MTSRTLPRGFGRALTTALLTVVAAACSGDDDGADASPTTLETSPSCDLLASAAVLELFDTHVGPGGQSGNGTTEMTVVPSELMSPDPHAITENREPEDTCLWETGRTDHRGSLQLQLSIYTDGRPLEPAAWGPGEGPEAVEGLGEEAFVVMDGYAGTTAGYRDSDRSVVLRYNALGTEGTAEQADAVIDLLRDAASAIDGSS